MGSSKESYDEEDKRFLDRDSNKRRRLSTKKRRKAQRALKRNYS